MSFYDAGVAFELYNTAQPHSALDGRTPAEACWTESLWI